MEDLNKLFLNCRDDKTEIKLDGLDISHSVNKWTISRIEVEPIIHIELKMTVLPEQIFINTEKANFK